MALTKAKVGDDTDTPGAWNYVHAKACKCIHLVGVVHAAGDIPLRQVCVADYSWVATSSTTAKYFATITGVGNDPAMGWAE